MKLETLISKALPENREHFDVIAYELWGNRKDGFDCNNAWPVARNADREQVLEAARGRWEVFKANYLPKARVKDISDIGYDDTVSLEVDCVPFLEIRPV